MLRLVFEWFENEKGIPAALRKAGRIDGTFLSRMVHAPGCMELQRPIGKSQILTEFEGRGTSF